ncbi:MAG: hypothetical protein PVJ31_07970, partial [Methyloceanibacter sp.]
MARRKSDKQTPDSGNAIKTKKVSVRLEDDSGLWARVADTAQPLANKNRFVDLGAPLATPAQAKARPPVDTGSASRSPTVSKPLRQHAGEKATVRTAPSPNVGLDRQTARKLDKGNLAIEARIDLHGMRQREAHSA